VCETTHKNIQRMVGNAVPSLLAEVLATAIRDQLLDSPRKFDSFTLLQPRQTLMPVWSKNSSVLRYQHLTIYCLCHNGFVVCLK
jgi:hypothetical protein